MTTPKRTRDCNCEHWQACRVCRPHMFDASGNLCPVRPPELLQNVIAERDALKAELEALRGNAEPVAWIPRKWVDEYTVLPNAHETVWKHPISDDHVPLYTRPCVPLTEERRGDLVMEHLGPAALTGGKMSVYDAFMLGIDAAEAAHKIGEKK